MSQKRKAELSQKTFNEKFTFEPELNPISRQLAEEDRPADFEEKIRKLAVVDVAKKECLLEQLRREEESKYTYKPELNKKSEIIAEKTRDPAKLTDWVEREKKRVEKLKVKLVLWQAIEEEKMRECKFKPEIKAAKQYTNVESAYTSKNYDAKMQEYHMRKKIEVGWIKAGRTRARRA